MCKKYHKLARLIYTKSTILVAWGGEKRDVGRRGTGSRHREWREGLKRPSPS